MNDKPLTDYNAADLREHADRMHCAEHTFEGKIAAVIARNMTMLGRTGAVPRLEAVTCTIENATHEIMRLPEMVALMEAGTELVDGAIRINRQDFRVATAHLRRLIVALNNIGQNVKVL